MSEIEPDLSRGEASLQEAVVAESCQILDALGVHYLLLERFGLDIALWISREASVAERFMELKVFLGARQGGVGFGNGRGEGLQVDILIQDSPKLALLEPSTRWILGDATLPVGSARFSIVSSTIAKAAAMGRVARGKQNNFRVAEFRRHAVTWPDFCAQLYQFLIR